MSSTYIIYNIVPYGFVLLLGYIFIDLFLDYFRRPKRSNLKRILLYSFLFYLLCLIQIKFGGISLPPINPFESNRTFIIEGVWFGWFDTMHFNISIWSSSAIFNNLVIFLPLGMYISILFHLNSNKKAVSIISLACIGVELFHLLFEKFGLVIGGIHLFVIMIFLLINIIGGIIGFLMTGLILKRINSFKNTGEVKIILGGKN